MKAVYVPPNFLTKPELLAKFVAGFGEKAYVEYIWIRPSKGDVMGPVKVVMDGAKSDFTEEVNQPLSMGNGRWHYQDKDYNFDFEENNATDPVSPISFVPGE